MTLRKSDQATMRMNAPEARQGSVNVSTMTFFTTVAAQMALNDVLELAPWPANTHLVSVKCKVEDLDTGTTLTLDFGILSNTWLSATNSDGTARTCDTTFAAASTVGQAGGSLDATSAQCLGIAPTAVDRSIGMKVAAAATGLTAGARIIVHATFMPLVQGVAAPTA